MFFLLGAHCKSCSESPDLHYNNSEHKLNLMGVVNGPFKNTGNFSGLAVSIFARIVSISESQIFAR